MLVKDAEPINFEVLASNTNELIKNDNNTTKKIKFVGSACHSLHETRILNINKFLKQTPF